MCQARNTELLKDLGSIPPAGESGEGIRAPEREELMHGIELYQHVREHTFECITAIFRDDQPGRTLLDEFRSIVAEATTGFDATIRRALFADCSATAQLWVERVANEERRFFDLLARADVAAEARDYIAEYRKRIEEKTAALDEKWKVLTESHESFGVSEKEAIEEVEKLAESATKYWAEWNQTFDESLVTFIGKLALLAKGVVVGTLLEIPEELHDLIHVLIETLENGSEWWKETTAGVETRIHQYKELLQSERGVVVLMFKDFRKDATEFVKDNGYEEVGKRTENARRALAEFSSGAGTSGLQGDASGLVGAVFPLLQAAADAAREKWDAFARKHEHKFFGPISPDFQKALLNPGDWSPAYQAIVSQNLNQLAQKWIDRRADRIVEIDQTDIPDAWQGQIYALLKDSLGNFLESQKKVRDSFQDEALRRAIIGEVEEALKDLE